MGLSFPNVDMHNQGVKLNMMPAAVLTASLQHYNTLENGIELKRKWHIQMCQLITCMAIRRTLPPVCY